MFLWESFFLRIFADFKQKQLLPIKLLFFVHSSTLYVLYPYLTIHMRALGISIEETAIMSAVIPLVTIIMPPLAGLVADKIGNFKLILAILSSLGGIAALLLLLVPIGRVSITYPSSTPVELSCNQGRLEMGISESLDCSKFNNNTRFINLRLEACGMTCAIPQQHFHPYADLGQAEGRAGAIVSSKEFLLELRQGNTSESYNYHLNGSSLAAKVTKVSNSSVFFPMSGLYEFTCEINEGKRSTCHVDKMQGDIEVVPKPQDLKMIVSRQPMGSRFNVEQIKQGSPGIADIYRPLSCTHHEDELSLQEHVISVSENEKIELKGCLVKCLASVPRKEVCSNKETVKDVDVSLTFWSYMAVRVNLAMVSGTSFAMFEGAVIAILREHKADYGLQKIYATIGGMISSPLSGWLIDYASEKSGFTDFRPAFYLYATLKLLSGFLMLMINLEFKAPAKNVIADVLLVLKNIEVVALLGTCFILGTAWGYIESFLFWLLQDLGGTKSLMGITITVGGIAGLPLLVMSGPIIDKIGHANVLFIGFIFYAIRLMGYSLIYNAWMCLIFEAMESITSSLAFTAAVTYAAKLSTTTTDSSIQGLLGGLYFGVGKGAGSLIGGYLMNYVGTRATYRIFAIVTFATGIIYFLFNQFYIAKRPDYSKKNQEEEECGKTVTITEKPPHDKSKIEVGENEVTPIALNKLNNYKSNEINSIKNVEENGGSQVNRGFDSDAKEKT